MRLVTKGALIRTVAVNPAQSAQLEFRVRELLRLIGGKLNLELMQALAPLGLGIVSESVPELAAAYQSMLLQGGPVAVYATGMPFDTTTEETPVGDFLSLALAALVGEPFQYTQQNGGRLIARLALKPGSEKKANTGEGNGEFQAHTDDRILAPGFSTDLIQLYGIRNDGGAWTTFTPLDMVLPELSEPAKQVLAEPRYVSKAPASFGFKQAVWSAPLPVLWKDESGACQVGLPTFNCRPAVDGDNVAQEALDEFIRLVNDERFITRVVIGPGTIFTLQNNRGLHARSAFEGYRLVLRTYIRGNLTPLRTKTGTTGNLFDAWKLLA